MTSKTRNHDKGKDQLTPLERRFCEEYLVDLNITKAAIRAGYSAKTANSTGWQVMQVRGAQEYLSELITAREKRTEITADRVLKELARVAFININEFIDESGRMLPPGNINKDAMATVAEITERAYGKDEDVIVEKKYKLCDKMKALDMLGRHLGLFTDKIEHSLTGSLTEILKELDGSSTGLPSVPDQEKAE